MRSLFAQFYIFTFANFLVFILAEADVRGYGYRPPEVQYNEVRDGNCNKCRPTQDCKSELDIRDETIPKEVPIPRIDYQIRWEAKPVHVVTDFDTRDNPCPIPVPLQEKVVQIEPRIRQVEKIVKVRVARIKENLVVQKIDRIKIVPVVQTRRKPVYVQHVRQVAAPVKVPVPKTVVQKKYTPEIKEIPVPVRVANILDVRVNRIDKPVEVPTVRYNYCEKVQEIQVKANCPTVNQIPKPEVGIPEGNTVNPISVGHAWDRRRLGRNSETK